MFNLGRGMALSDSDDVINSSLIPLLSTSIMSITGCRARV